MYRIRLAIVAFLLATIGLQAQEGFYYQAVIKNTDGSPLKETPVKIRIRIIEGTTTLQYEEEKEVTTSREGFVSFIIGEGATTDFTSINWQGELYLQDEIDTGAGYGAPTRMPLLKTPRSYISDRAISVLDNSITSASILDGTISNNDLSAAASISFSKLSISASDIEGLGFLQSDESFTSALKTKLDGIEAGAQVTDATNVEAAGAIMDSEITNLADVKAFDPADYATAAQGALADSAQQVLAEGAFTDGDKTKLDGIEAGANAYSLPTATSDILGGVKVGTGITITNGVIAIGQAVGTSDDVSFSSVTAAIAGNVTGDILAADGTSILDNGTNGTDATFTGNVTGTVSSLTNQDTDALTEGSTNLYFTDARAQGAITAGTGVSITSGQIAIGQAVGTSDDVSFSSVTAAIAGNVTGDILAADGTSILDNGTDGTDATFTGNVTGTVSSLTNQDTDALTEGSTNLYFTDARAQGAITAGTGVSITSGQIAIGQAVGTSDDVSFSSVTAAIAGNVTGDILAADGTSILDNGTNGTDATFTGNVTGTVSSLTNQDTDALTEGSTNLYFTDARAQGAITAGTGVSITSGQIAIGQAVGTSDDVSFSSVTAAIAGNVTGDILAADGTSILDNGTDGTDATFTGNVTGTVSSLTNQDTDALTEGSTNLYFTDARAQGAITAGTGVSITSGQIAIGQAVGTSDDVSFSSVTAAIAGNVTGDILAADGTSILDNGTNGTDATFTGNSATATTLSATLPINLGGTGATSAPMIGVITAADANAARTELNIITGTFDWSNSPSNFQVVNITGVTASSIVTISMNDEGNNQFVRYVKPEAGKITIQLNGDPGNGTKFSYFIIP